MWIEWIEKICIHCLFDSCSIHSFTHYILILGYIGDKLCEMLCAHDEEPLMIMNEQFTYYESQMNCLCFENTMSRLWLFVSLSPFFFFRLLNRIWGITKRIIAKQHNSNNIEWKMKSLYKWTSHKIWLKFDEWCWTWVMIYTLYQTNAVKTLTQSKCSQCKRIKCAPATAHAEPNSIIIAFNTKN